MTRADRAAQAARLHAQGLNGIQIAQRLGIARSYAYELLNDPDGSCVRERKRRYDLTCVECSGRVSGTDPGRMADPAEPVCATCAASHYAVWTRDAIVLAMQKWAHEHGEPPRSTDWHSQDATHPWFSHVLYRFGTWNAAVEAAGLTPRPTGHYGRPGEDPAVVAETAALYESGLSLAQVGARMGVSATAVLNRLKKAGVPRRPAYRPKAMAA